MPTLRDIVVVLDDSASSEMRLTVAVGLGLTVTVALPEEVPVQLASDTAVTV